ncbi:unnamed protein product [Caenorhabditis bovis]|uniref:mitogen-activated protein kinase kinase n=1 Tax=Caenorhabditis bovis TaxID=2654633 RepID=A0A8S1EMN9_9PELO|nr:unnamed protein product [Caenorhabditis bovis]
MENVCFQQRLRDLESRIRKWRFLKLGFSDVRLRQRERRSTSADQRLKESSSTNASPQHHRPNNIGYLTSPMERKFTPLSMKPSPSRRDTEKDELDLEFLESCKKSGIIELDEVKQLVSPSEINVLELLGSGSCGIVECVKIRNKKLAIKTMYKNDNKETLRRILRDVRIMSVSQSPFIVKSFGCFMFDSSVKICMQIMATCCEKLLRRIYHSQMDFFPEFVAGRLVFSIVNALNYLKEQHNIIHRDIKPSNILLDYDGSFRLCDFGISGYLSETKLHTNNTGCPPYMAPERLTFEKNSTYDERSDVWSLGVTIFQLTTGKYPFPLHDLEFTTLTIIADLNIPPPTLKNEEKDIFTEEFVDFVDKCLIKNSTERPKYQYLMEHNFYKDYDPMNVDRYKISTLPNSLDDVAEWFQKILESTKKSDENRPIPNTPCVN